MSAPTVLTEKYALIAVIQSALASLVPSAATNVYLDAIDEPYTGTYPAIIVSRLNYTTTELYAMNLKGNPENRANIYKWEYIDNLVSETGSTLEQTMAAHDAFLEAVIQAFQDPLNQALIDENGLQNAENAGFWIDAVQNGDGPFALRDGNSVIISQGRIAVNQRLRAITS